MNFLLSLLLVVFFVNHSFCQDTVFYKKGKIKTGLITKIEDRYIVLVPADKKNEIIIPLKKIERYIQHNQPVRPEVIVRDTKEEKTEDKDIRLPYSGEKVSFNNSFNTNDKNVQNCYARLLRYAQEKEEGITKTIKTKNPEQNSIVVRCMVPSSYETFFKTENSKVFFNLKIKVADEKYQIELTDFYIESPDANTTIEVWDSHSGEFFQSQLVNIYRQMTQLLKDIENRIKSYE